jgi:branched-chain amino acid transport system substrate-binding protein
VSNRILSNVFLAALLLPTIVIADDRPLKFGVLAPLTGDYASAGEEIRRGAELAQDRLKEDGREIQIYFEDACLPAQGVSSFKRLAEIVRVDAVVSNYCLISLAAIAPLLRTSPTLIFQNSISPAVLVTSNPNVITTWPSIEDEVTASFSSLSDERIRRVALFYLESPWGIAFAESVRAHTKGRGGALVIDSSQGWTVHEFRSELTKLIAQKATTVFVIHTGGNLTSFLRQAHTSNVDMHTVIIPSDAEDRDIVRASGVAAEGASLFSVEPGNTTSELESFEDGYRAKYGREPAPLGRHGYDETLIAAKIVGDCGRNGTCARERLVALSPFRGATGVFSFTESGLTKRSFVKKSVKGGQFLPQ